MYGRYMKRRLTALGGRFHGYYKLKALTVSVTVRLRGLLVFDPSDVVVAARVAACVLVLRIDNIYTASITVNNVGTSSSIKYM